MSRDDWIAIVKRKDIFRGYALSGSREYNTIKSIIEQHNIFKTDSIVEAILLSQDYNAEYGYKFVNLKRKNE